MYFNPLYKKFTIICLSIILVFINGSYNNEVHAQKLNLNQKIASIKWPSILQGKRISLDDTLKQEPQSKVKKTKLQAPAKEPKVKKIKPESQPKVQAKPKKQPKLKPQVSPTSNRIQIKLPKISLLFKKQIDQLNNTKRKDTSIRIGKVPLKRLKQNKIDGVYTPLKVSVADFSEFIKSMHSLGFSGFNITIPHKESALKLCNFNRKNFFGSLLSTFSL